MRLMLFPNAAAGKGVSIHIWIEIDWPTPTGLGTATIYAYDCSNQGGEWALTVGLSIIALIESVRIKAIKIAKDLFFSFCIFFLPSNLIEGKHN